MPSIRGLDGKKIIEKEESPILVLLKINYDFITICVERGGLSVTGVKEKFITLITKALSLDQI